MARSSRRPVKVGVKRSGQGGKKLRSSRKRPPLEPREKDVERSRRKGQSGQAGRPLPSRKSAVKGLAEERKARAVRARRRMRSISTGAGGPDAGPGEGARE